MTIDDMILESATLNDRTKMIAEYWADGPKTETSPGHWNVIAQWVSRRHGQTLDQDVKTLFSLNGALLDASICVWYTKYRDDFARPVTVIRTLRAGQQVTAWGGPGQGTQTIHAEQWRFYIPTPPIPEYRHCDQPRPRRPHRPCWSAPTATSPGPAAAGADRGPHAGPARGRTWRTAAMTTWKLGLGSES